MAKWVLLVQTDCTDAAQVKEFNQWYDTIHIPDILEAPGFVSASRYEIPSPAEGQGRFLAIYEIESDDVQAAFSKMQEHLAKKREQGRMSKLVKMVSRTFGKEITPPIRRK